MSEIEDRIKALESELAQRRDRDAEIVKRLRVALERANASPLDDIDQIHQIYVAFWHEVGRILIDMEKSILQAEEAR